MIFRSAWNLYIRPATIIAYMLQSSEYESIAYLRWFWRTQDFSRVMNRRTLELTRRARLVRLGLRLGMLVQIIAGIGLVAWGMQSDDNWQKGVCLGLALLISYPIIWAHIIVLPLALARLLIVRPSENRHIAASSDRFKTHPAVKIAVAGSYGKTTMKELLLTVLSEGRKVAATPGNKNVSISHANFSKQLEGDEDVLIIEYGEGKPGDVARFTRLTHPDYAVITGLAPAHLDHYKTLDAAAEDILSLAGALPADHVYANAESPLLKPYIKPEYTCYDANKIGAYTISDVRVDFDGVRFWLRGPGTGSEKTIELELHSRLLGRHQVGPLAAVVVLALQLGLTPHQVINGIAKTKPYEHRMQPYRSSGAWIIDDTYNGNIEGIRAGTELLAELPAKRRWYVSPGLVEQGAETAIVHQEMGRLIAAASPDVVVLMQNSVTKFIKVGLESAGFRGELRLETDPLSFYKHLDQFVAAGDVVLMQNDWTDNYA